MRKRVFSDFLNRSMILRYPDRLLDAAARDLKMKGMDIMRGPMNFSTNEECGFLIEGFDTPPMLMTPYNPLYYTDLMKQYGMQKIKDLYAYIYDVQENSSGKGCEGRGNCSKARHKCETHS